MQDNSERHKESWNKQEWKCAHHAIANYGVDEVERAGRGQHIANHDVRKSEKAKKIPRKRDLQTQSPFRRNPRDQDCRHSDIDIDIRALKGQHFRNQAIDPKLMQEQLDPDAKDLRGQK
jgi:hypothetical protein